MSKATYWELWSPDCTRQWAFSDDRRSPRAKVYRFTRTTAGRIAGKLLDEFTMPAEHLEDGTAWPENRRAIARANPSAPRVVDLWRRAPRREGVQPNTVYARLRDLHYNPIGLLAAPHRGTPASIRAAVEAMNRWVLGLPSGPLGGPALSAAHLVATDALGAERWELTSTGGVYPGHHAHADWVLYALRDAAQARHGR